MAGNYSMHGLSGCNGVNPTKPCAVSTNNTLAPTSYACSSLCSSGIAFKQVLLLLFKVGFFCSLLGNRVNGLVYSGASFNSISQSLV